MSPRYSSEQLRQSLSLSLGIAIVTATAAGLGVAAGSLATPLIATVVLSGALLLPVHA